MTAKSLPSRRPAETTAAGGGALAVALLALGAPEPLIILAGAVATVGPAIVTWLVSRDLPGRAWRWLVAQGGIRGVVRMLWAGRG